MPVGANAESRMILETIYDLIKFLGFLVLEYAGICIISLLGLVLVGFMNLVSNL